MRYVLICKREREDAVHRTSGKVCINGWPNICKPYTVLPARGMPWRTRACIIYKAETAAANAHLCIQEKPPPGTRGTPLSEDVRAASRCLLSDSKMQAMQVTTDFLFYFSLADYSQACVDMRGVIIESGSWACRFRVYRRTERHRAASCRLTIQWNFEAVKEPKVFSSAKEPAVKYAY